MANQHDDTRHTEGGGAQAGRQFEGVDARQAGVDKRQLNRRGGERDSAVTS